MKGSNMRLPKEMVTPRSGRVIPDYEDIEYERICWNCARPVDLGRSHCQCGATNEVNFSLPEGRLY
jgi:hypothetical protein